MDTGEIAQTVLLQAVQQQLPRPRWLAEVLAALDESTDEASRYTLLRVGHVLSWGSVTHAVAHISDPPTATQTVALALYCLLRFDQRPVQYQQAALIGHAVSHLVQRIHEIEEVSDADTK